MSTWTAADGASIYYEVHGGSGPTLLLIPGLLGTLAGQWAPYLGPLAEDYRVIAMDLRGHGRSENAGPGSGEAGDDGTGAGQSPDLGSDPAPGSLTLEAMLGDVIGVLDQVGADRVHLAGYSLGGYLGLMLGLRQPERLATLLMHGTKFYWTADSAAAAVRQLDPDLIAAKVPTYAAQLAREHGEARWADRARGAAGLVAGMIDAGLAEAELAAVRCPAVVSVGDRDELVPLDEAERLRRALPSAGLLVLPRVRHAFATARPAELLPVMRHLHRP